MDREVATINKHPTRALRFLLCDVTGRFGEFSSRDEVGVLSAIRCLDKAIEANPGIIVVLFGKISLEERKTLLDLCSKLKRNSSTRNCTVLALLYSKHRKLLESLDRAKVDYVRYVADEALDSNLLRGIIKELGPDDCLERHLRELCPFLHYSKIDSLREMPVCGAYLDRMVLGGRRLSQLCHTANHVHCEYFMNPRP